MGEKDSDLLVVSWGGSFGHVYEAVEEMNAQGKKVAMAHFNYINPLPANAEEVLKSYKKVIVCEQNDGQFAGYLRMKIDGLTPLQFNRVEGQPFKVADLVECFTKLLEE
jgi:2-oxoglutarate ferredoxin oxidoreductase subunit alpha